MPFPTASEAYQVLTRKKPIETSSESKLAKVLSAFDLTALGIGSTLGVGVYVLAGTVSKNEAGPAIVICFLIAAIASIFAGLCYAEFGARVPKAGSAYIYSYVTIGEFIAFLIGWNLILEYAIGSASVVKALSLYLDSYFGSAMENFLKARMPIHITGLSEYPDFLAFGVTILFALAIALGAKESTRVNNVFTMLNLGVVLFVLIAGLFKVSTSNWMLAKSSVPAGYGNGGFAPYGFAGILKGAATCFYGFIGFDCIATAGEEAKNPKKSIPFAVITSLAMIFLAYFGVSTVLTMMLPYYEQDEKAPLPHVFRIYGWAMAEYIVTFGAMFGLCASLMGSMFPLPRIVFALASDGLLFRFMGEIHNKYKTPFNGTLLTGALTGLLAGIFKLDQLVDMMSIGTLMAYSMVASCVLMLRYECSDERSVGCGSCGRGTAAIGNGRVLLAPQRKSKCAFWRQLFNTNGTLVPTRTTSRIVTVAIALYFVWCLIFSQLLIGCTEVSVTNGIWMILAALPVLLTLYVISCQPVSTSVLSFKVPLVPWLPGASILINIYLMNGLDIMTWIRFCIWIFLGLIIYFCYSMHHSCLRTTNSTNRFSLQCDGAPELLNEVASLGTEVPLICMHS